MTTQISVRLTSDVLEAIERLVPASFGSRSELVRRAIEEYLHRVARDNDTLRYEQVPLTDAELSLVDDPGAWAPTPRW
jgi:Arc/MetJ-type ribon-helix-helix transcriptional regulator